ncbi:unnamed protein product [Adineta ricciae]|uniref:Selenoprotein F n=1 Tax=Adineta ricciae TaxID=249248 RepID=A0A814A085_ADIRI|nr:unnamed protein product [Adineta ricciae]CAF1193175.1 unnamed protein product [Adineta ricciae]
MRTADFLAAFLSQFLACIVLATSESLSEGQCSDLGFASNNLKVLVDNAVATTKMKEKEKRNIIEQFFNDRPARFPSFSVQYVRGADPILNLFNEQDEQIESMGIEKWDTDTLTSFLEENLAH